MPDDFVFYIVCNNRYAIYLFRHYEVIVSKLLSGEVPSRHPQTYTNSDIKNGVNGLYIAICKAGVPKNGVDVVIGHEMNNRRKRNVGGEAAAVKMASV